MKHIEKGPSAQIKIKLCLFLLRKRTHTHTRYIYINGINYIGIVYKFLLALTNYAPENTYNIYYKNIYTEKTGFLDII